MRLRCRFQHLCVVRFHWFSPITDSPFPDMRPNVPAVKVFTYTFLGLYLSCALIQTLGAAFGAAALSEEVATWTAAYTNGGVGGLVGEALLPLKWFGKILLVFFAVGMVSNNGPTICERRARAALPRSRTDPVYPLTDAFSLSLQIVFPFLAALPRWIFPLVGTAIYLPIAIVGARNFEAALVNFLGLLGYWTAIFCAVVFVEVSSGRGIRRATAQSLTIRSTRSTSSSVPADAAHTMFQAGTTIARSQAASRLSSLHS